jgi:hypothetical protein
MQTIVITAVSIFGLGLIVLIWAMWHCAKAEATSELSRHGKK